VTYWDAYAYAHWKGRDLPTEEEWEAAARGRKGNKYPWSDELDLKRLNSNNGYVALKRGQSVDDGYNYWSPVDAFKDDESPFEVIGMAGNVAEWAYRKEGAKEQPVIKGSSFATPPQPAYERLTTLTAEDYWFVLPAANRPKGKADPVVNNNSYVGDPVKPDSKALYIREA
jgi:formylglycine-generating enzyme required for sulfatase activity